MRLGGAGALVLLALAALGEGRGIGPREAAPGLDRLFARDTITILVTDSGLGGLAVAADLERGLRERRAFRQVQIVFANALPDRAYTYNGMPSMQARADAFDRALEGMTGWYKPDLIVIACNTLSVVYPHTRFAARGRVPVVGIVEYGVSAIARRLRADPSAVALILGTPTTVADGAHASGLRDEGVAPSRIVGQACPNLETEIQADPDGDLVRNLAEAYASEAQGKLGPRASGNVVAALCCSHYGYSRAAFEAALREQVGPHVEILDPNVEMSGGLLAHARAGAFPQTETRIRVASRAELTEGERESIGRVLQRLSPRTAAALRSYERKADLFDPPAGRR